MTKVPEPRAQGPEGLLPVHGFVLAGGKSSRMGVDKAGLMFRGRLLAEIAVAKLAGLCTEVAIAGNREDLARIAPVVMETRTGVGPGAGIEAGLQAARFEWCLFVPVDVPLLPVELLRRWMLDILAAEGVRGSYLVVDGMPQPSICLLRRECVAAVSAGLDRGERKLRVLLEGAVAMDAGGYGSASELRSWFLNLNTPEEFAEAESG